MKLFLLLIHFSIVLTAFGQRKNSILIRGPYLQIVGENTATIRWKTHQPTDSKFSVGEIFGNYVITSTDPKPTTEHEVKINGLKPDTKYYYQFGSISKIKQKGKRNFFWTAPTATASRKIQIAVFGDCGRNYFDYQTTTLRAYRKFVSDDPAQLLLLLGDNAYYEGTEKQYQRRFFNIYNRTILKNHALFPAPGNHDYYSGSPTDRNLPYYNIFSMPAHGELGGVPSGTKAYYSYNWGNIHFISLDSYGTENNGSTRLFDTSGAQATWLKKDLEANQQLWTIVYWHHPPHSKGSHDSDDEWELINLRTNLNPILERFGVDLVLCGHSHDYERSFPLKNYYGKEAGFQPQIHTTSTSTARYDGSENSCPYIMSGQSNSGTVYVVSGSSGAGGRIQEGYPHNAMPFSLKEGGMFYIEVEGNRLNGKFLQRNGKIGDQFTLMKQVNKTHNVIIQAGFSAELKASWTGNYIWSNGDTAKSITVSPIKDTQIIVQDKAKCLKDTFHITVHQPKKTSH
jgi:3',5'-cyclic AMP phosphodiesterase CpdA